MYISKQECFCCAGSCMTVSNMPQCCTEFFQDEEDSRMSVRRVVVCVWGGQLCVWGGQWGSTDFYGQGVFSMFLPLSDVLDLTHTLKGSNPTPTLTLTLKLSCQSRLNIISRTVSAPAQAAIFYIRCVACASILNDQARLNRPLPTLELGLGLSLIPLRCRQDLEHRIVEETSKIECMKWRFAPEHSRSRNDIQPALTT